MGIILKGLLVIGPAVDIDIGYGRRKGREGHT